jgi:hypothetical protein
MVRTGWLLALLALAPAARHFDVMATFEPAKKAGGEGAVAKLNETPAPRLKLDLTQTVLEDRQPQAPAQVPDFDPLTARYLDTSKPVRFPATVSSSAPSGQHEVKANVVYFYCSTREAWCRRGSVDVLIPVTVR